MESGGSGAGVSAAQGWVSCSGAAAAGRGALLGSPAGTRVLCPVTHLPWDGRPCMVPDLGFPLASRFHVCSLVSASPASQSLLYVTLGRGRYQPRLREAKAEVGEVKEVGRITQLVSGRAELSRSPPRLGLRAWDQRGGPDAAAPAGSEGCAGQHGEGTGQGVQTAQLLCGEHRPQALGAGHSSRSVEENAEALRVCRWPAGASAGPEPDLALQPRRGLGSAEGGRWRRAAWRGASPHPAPARLALLTSFRPHREGEVVTAALDEERPSAEFVDLLFCVHVSTYLFI